MNIDKLNKIINEVSDETVDNLLNARKQNYLNDETQQDKLERAKDLARKRAAKQNKTLDELAIGKSFVAFAHELGMEEVSPLVFEKDGFRIYLKEAVDGLTVELGYICKGQGFGYIAYRTAQELPKDFKEDVLKEIKVCGLTESLADEIIFDLGLIREVLDMQEDWLESIGVGEDGRADEVMFFVIKNNEIVDTHIIKRNDVYDYQPQPNEYYLKMSRDTGWWDVDYSLAPVQLMVNDYNSSKNFFSK